LFSRVKPLHNFHPSLPIDTIDTIYRQFVILLSLPPLEGAAR
jgi:hypothetical protein